MKSPDQTLTDVTRRLGDTWADCLAQEAVTGGVNSQRAAAAVPAPTGCDSRGEDSSTCLEAPPAHGRQHPGAAARWPHAFPLGRVAASAAERDFPALAAAVSTWRAWAAARQLELRWENRRLLGTPQQIPTHLVVDTLDHAASLAGDPWPQRLARGRARAAELAARYPHLLDTHQTDPQQDEPDPDDPVLAGPGTDEPRDPSALTVEQPAEQDLAQIGDRAGSTPGPTARLDLRRVLRAVDELSDIDFDLLCRAGDWFRTHDAHGLTPRQVPIEGLHAKWLNSRRHLVRALADVADLGLMATHPPRIHFTYLDPDHRASGARLHDSATVGDTAPPAYLPRIVIISENKDTALYFPEMPGAISVEGVGSGGSTIAAFDWITQAETLIYWGDMDADGLEILNEFRAVGVPATSILMDLATYARWERFGTDRDRKGQLLKSQPPRPVPNLTPDEAELYHCLIAPTWTRLRRIEQERLPLSVARACALHLAD